MDTEKAIKFLEEEIKYWGPTISSNMKKVPYECEPGNPLAVKIYKEIIKLLQQGESLKKDLIQFLEKENPYPEDVFLVIKKEDLIKINNLLKKEMGYSIDRLFGNFGRKIYRTIIEDLKKVIK